MEGNSVFSLLEKSAGLPDPVPRVGSSKRGNTHNAHRRPNSPLSVPAGHVSFGILCLINQVGVVIGTRGRVIKQIQQSTESRIRVESGFPGCRYRVIRVTGPVGLTSRVKLGVNNAIYGEEDQEEEEIEVSKAQEALIRVFEVLNDGVSTGTVSCKLLMEAGHVGAVKGEGGEMLERIRKETGCEVEIRTNRLPICADPDDAMVEIEGNVLAVTKALVSVSSRLQACQIYETRMIGNKSLGRAFEESMHRHLNNNIQKALPRPVEINSHDYRLRKDDMYYSHGTLSRSSDGIPHNARHRQIEAFPRGALHRYTEAVPHDALGRTMDVVPREALYRSSDGFQGDVSRQHREVDPRDSLHRHFDIGQDSFPPDAYHAVSKRTVKNFSSQRRIDSLSHRSSVLDTCPHSITASASRNHASASRNHASASRNHPVTIKQPLSAKEDENQTVVFKLLCPAESVGVVIDSVPNIKTHESVIGASIDVGDTPPDCDECLITFTSSENPKDEMPPAQAAIGRVFSRLCEISTKDSGSRSSITARLVVPTNQIRCLLVSKIWKSIGACILVLEVAHNPKCISANDQVVQISGEIPAVKLAMYHATSRVANFLRNSRTNSATKSKDTYISGRISRGETTNPGSTGFHPSSSHSLTKPTGLHRRPEDSFQRGSHNPVHYSKPVDADPYIIPEDPFPNRFSHTARYPPNFGRRSTMDVNDILDHLSEDSSQFWGSENTFTNDISDHLSEDSSQLWGSENTFTNDISDHLSEDSSQLWGSEDPFPNRFSPIAGYSQNFGWRSTKDVNDILDHLSDSPSQLRASPLPGAPRGDYDGNGGLSSTMADLGLGSEHNSSVVTNMTVEIRVPENAVHFVFGEEGGQKRLEDLRQMSGATVTVHEPQLGTSDRIIAISGTPVEIQIAQKLLQAFIQIGESISMIGGLFF